MYQTQHKMYLFVKLNVFSIGAEVEENNLMIKGENKTLKVCFTFYGMIERNEIKMAINRKTQLL